MDEDSIYEYPISLDNTPMSPSQASADQHDALSSTHPPFIGDVQFNGDKEHSPVPRPQGDDSDSDYVEQEHISVKQAEASSTRDGRNLENSNKIYVKGSLPSYHSTFKGRSRSISSVNELTGSLSEQGIYQGLAMTDTVKQTLGIMPESVYMATNLLENLGGEIELVNVADEGENGESGGAGLEEEEVVDGRSRLGSRTDPNIFKPKIRRPLRASAPAFRRGSIDSRPVVPRYRNYVVRPPPLPPVFQHSTLAERKAYGVVESLLKSEASLLSSLQIAIQVYMKPLRELSLGPSPILNQQQVAQLFGPIEQILKAQELFYSALTSRTLGWNPLQKIGDIFLSSLATKEVIRQYSAYVNNFTPAIAVLERGLNKKSKFVIFLRERYQQSNTSLSLQGLLLKPIQRFPQYIMFIQDLLKYTPHDHPDRITLQMALARFEGIAEYLNESKRITEQRSIVEYLNNRVSKLPFKLTDSRQRWLHRQDVVTRLWVSGTKVTLKKRFLLLFNNMVLCAAPSKRKGRREELESTTGSRLFKAVDGCYTCKWHSPVDTFDILEPDYHKDIWDLFIDTDLAPDNLDHYKRAKNDYRKLEHDFNVMTKIASSASTLHHEYEGLTMSDVTTHIRVLQRKLANVREQIESHQAGRLDISILTSDGSKRVTHTYMFPSKEAKNAWINTLRYVKLKLNKSNKDAWVTSEDTNDEDFFDLSHKLPLLVESYRLSMLHTLNSIQCATKVGDNSAWLASGNLHSAQITIVECVTPAPLILESFNVDSSRVIDILYVPPAAYCDATLTATMKRMSLRDTLKNMGTLTNLPPHLATVWMGAECGRLSVYSSQSIEDGTKKCLSSVKLNDAITTLRYYKDQVIVSTAEGNIVIFQRNLMGWNLTEWKTISVVGVAIRCTCLVKNRLWIGVNNVCYFLNLQTHKIEGSQEMISGDKAVVVNRMVCWGEGVWVSFKGSSSLELFHTVTKASLQNIDVKATLNSIMKRRGLLDKHPIRNRVHVTALLASSGYLWIGTSVGIIMVYRIPLIEGVPLVTAKPYLAMDGHKGQVRVILTVETKATVSSTRVDQFLSAERRDSNTIRPSGIPRDGLNVKRFGRGMREETDGEIPSPKGSPAPPVRLLVEEEQSELFESRDDLYGSGGFDTNDDTLGRSTTPILPPPSTVELEASVYDHSMEINTPKDNTPEIYTPPPSDEENGFEQSQEVGVEQRDTETPQLAGEIESTEPGGASGQNEAVNSVKVVSILGGEDSLPNVPVPGDQTISSQTSSGLTASEILPTEMEESLDFLDDVLKSKNQTQAPLFDGHAEQSSHDHQLITHHVQDLVEEGDDSSPYAPILEKTLLKRNPTATAMEKHRAKDIYLQASDSLDGYDDPSVLDAVTMRRVPSDEMAQRLGEEESSLDSMLLTRESEEANPYEDPATLDRSGPLSANQLFSSTLVRNNQPTVPGRPKSSKDRSIFVLTCGRGLIDLRHSPKSNVLFPTAKSGSKTDKEEEGCVLAYELEQ